MIKRIVTGILLAAGLIGVVVFGPFLLLAGVLALAVLPALWEFMRLPGDAIKGVDRVATLLAGTAILALSAFLPADMLSRTMPSVLAGLCLGLLVLVLFQSQSIEKAGLRATHMITGLLYVAFLGSFAILAGRPENGDHGRHVLLFAAAVTWVNDSAAFFAGKFLGRHKLYPIVSPNKTWEGSIGGLAGAVLGTFFVRWILDVEVDAFKLVSFAVVGGILGQIGDLAESLFKRTYAVKDSGTILPGHGGLLDRIDAFLFVAPVAYIWFFV